MRAILLGVVAATLLNASPVLAQSDENAARDCVRGGESGHHPPQHRGAKFLYLVNTTGQYKEGPQTYNVSWQIASSLKEACEAAQNEVDDAPANDGWSRKVSNAILIPDKVLREGLLH